MFNSLKRAVAMAGLTLTLGMSVYSVAKADTNQWSNTPPDPAMVRAMKYGTPGEHHKALGVLIGKWSFTGEMRMTPEGKFQTMSGTTENTWILGNRFVSQEVMGGDPAMPFQGMGIIGYDNIRQEYTSIWVDNMSTGINEASASYNPETQTFSEKGSVSCPITKEKHRPYRAVLKVIDNNHYTYEMYMRTLSGREFRALSINYQRAE